MLPPIVYESPHIVSSLSFTRAALLTHRSRLLRREVKAEAAAEPVLSSFLHAAVVAQPSLTASVAWVLAHRLDGTDGGALDPVRLPAACKP